jgi:hypothetical protein
VSRSAVDLLLYLMDEAFDAPDHDHSLLHNLASVTDDIWMTKPPDGGRSIMEMAGHVAACKFVYDNYAFGDASMTWDDPRWYEPRTRGEMTEWLKDGQRTLRAHVAELADEDLLTLRRANWGAMYETRWLASAMIEHDLYHGGEINHLRALLQGNDRWAWEGEGG